MTIGERIKVLRETHGLTQTELGKICGITKQTIFKYESGLITNIPMDRICTIAKALSVSPAFLMGWETPEYYTNPEAAELAQKLLDRPELRVLLDASKDASKEDIEAIVRLLKK